MLCARARMKNPVPSTGTFTIIHILCIFGLRSINDCLRSLRSVAAKPLRRVTTSSLEEEVYPTGAGETRRAAHPLSSLSSRFLEARFLLRSSTSRARHALLPHRTMCALLSSGFDQMFISWLRSLRRLLNRSCSMQQSSSSHAAYRSLPVPNLVPTSGTSTTVKLCIVLQCVFPL